MNRIACRISSGRRVDEAGFYESKVAKAALEDVARGLHLRAPMHLPSLLYALVGGALVGVSVSIAFVALSRVAGISGILGGLVDDPRTPGEDRSFRLAFVAGLVATGGAIAAVAPDLLVTTHAPNMQIVLGGVLVGFGTRLGNGCTSGHGVCGLSRFSSRSLISTLTFLGVGMLTVFVYRAMLGGAP